MPEQDFSKLLLETANKGADAYILKPFDMDDVLNEIREHLKKQQEAKKYSQEEVTEFIENRVKEPEEEKTRTNKKLRKFRLCFFVIV